VKSGAYLIALPIKKIHAQWAGPQKLSEETSLLAKEKFNKIID
jgi:hypothetical protein